MIIWRKGRPSREEPAPRPNPTRIAVLEHDLLGVQPQPGSLAAASIAFRQAGACLEHQPVDVSTFADPPGTVMLCTRCGNYVIPADDGGWRTATTA